MSYAVTELLEGETLRARLSPVAQDLLKEKLGREPKLEDISFADGEVFRADLATYGGRGVRHVTSFAVYMDAEYVERHGEPPLEEYGGALGEWRPGE